MSGTPIEKFVSAHGSLRKFGNRYRGACPACGGSEKSVALSVSETDNGTLLLKCFKEDCFIEDIARSIGLEVTDLFPPRLDAHHVPGPKRRSLITPREALELVEFECSLIWTAGFNLANGHALTRDDLQRLNKAANRVMSVIAEVRA